MADGSGVENVVVTGAADSVGRVMAEKFLALGHRVHICDVRGDALAATLAANPGMRGTLASVGKPAEVEALFAEAIGWMGGVDILVNNVGIGGPRAAIEDVSYADWDEVVTVDLNGMFYCMKQVLPGMKARRHGVIVNFSSGSTRTGLPFRAPYVAAKYGVEGLTKNAARELGPFNIRCNAILPGMIDNARMRGIVERNAKATGKTVEEIEEGYLRYISMRTKIQPAEIADMVLYLCSPAARHVSGQLIGVCGNLEWEE
jgi:NAD(P)-dependent dehydrogenase (short-subunit alcohol dehydrogenase family)